MGTPPPSRVVILGCLSPCLYLPFSLALEKSVSGIGGLSFARKRKLTWSMWLLWKLLLSPSCSLVGQGD